MILAWGAKVSEDFCNRVVAICANSFPYEGSASDLMACMAFESGGTFSPHIRNAAGSGAIGLIQFMPDTAKDLGTSTYALSLMTPEDQLTYVQKYFHPYANRIHSLSDMYMAILMPKYVGAPDITVVFSGNTTSYRQNMGLDTNKDGEVTKGEICARLFAKRNEGLLPINLRELGR
jgi:hypothetical protein